MTAPDIRRHRLREDRSIVKSDIRFYLVCFYSITSFFLLCFLFKMDSFFQRMSSMVIKQSNKVSEEDVDDNDDDDIDDIEAERQRQFHYLAGRRRSAPDIRRNIVLKNHLIQIPPHKGTSDEQISTHFHTSILPRKHYNSIGKCSFYNYFNIYICL